MDLFQWRRTLLDLQHYTKYPFGITPEELIFLRTELNRAVVEYNPVVSNRNTFNIFILSPSTDSV
jgi:hypothetical protein